MTIDDFKIGDFVMVTQLTTVFEPEDISLFKKSRIEQRENRAKGVIISKLVGVGSNHNHDFLVVCHPENDHIAVYSPDELKNIY